MKIVNMAKKLQNKLLKGKQPFFMQDITEQRKLLESFPEPQNLIERSYFQYVCQAKQIPLVLRIIQNTTSIFLLCNLIFMKKREVNNLHSSQSNIAVFIDYKDNDIGPPAAAVHRQHQPHTSTCHDGANESRHERLFRHDWRPLKAFEHADKGGQRRHPHNGL